MAAARASGKGKKGRRGGRAFASRGRPTTGLTVSSAAVISFLTASESARSTAAAVCPAAGTAGLTGAATYFTDAEVMSMR